MDFVELLQAVFLGVVEGLTEFLPISSTGHLIVAGVAIGFNEAGAETFFIAIQAGAIVAVCWFYRVRIWLILLHIWHPGQDRKLAINTVAAFLPAALIGVCVASTIKYYLFNPVTVAIALVVGGGIILWVESQTIQNQIQPRVLEMDDLSIRDAIGVGFMQCLAMIPGVSRSGATIIGGLVLGLSRKAATEFSFFLSIPTIFGATAYDLYKSYDALSVTMLPAIGVGFVVSFFSAIVVVKWLLGFVSRSDFRGFGWYRIAFGCLILACVTLGKLD